MSLYVTKNPINQLYNLLKVNNSNNMAAVATNVPAKT